MTDYVQEFLADLAKKIAEEEDRVRERIERLSLSDAPEDDIREEWRRFNLRIKPMQENRDYILKQLTRIEVSKPIPHFVIPKPLPY